MSFHVIDDGSDRQRWLQSRTGGVSATDAARIMTGGAGTWASLRREKATGGGFGGNAYTQHGREREAAIAEYARHTFGLVPSTALVARCEDVAFGQPYPLDLATPDALAVPTVAGLGITYDGALVEGMQYDVDAFGEYKTTVHDWDTWADVPKRYFWQVTWQFLVTGAQRCYFVFEAHEDFVPLHMEPRHFVIERADMLDAIADAQAQVTTWRSNEGEELPEDLVPLDGMLSARQRAKETADAAAARVTALDAEIRELLIAHGREVKHEGSDANLTWSGKTTTRQSFDATAFKARYPAAHRRFIKTSEVQPRLNITARS